MPDHPHITPRDFAGVLDVAHDALAEWRQADGAGAEEESTTVQGADPEGHVRATIGTDGRVVSVDIAPRALRLPSQDLAAAVVVAVNAAQAQLVQLSRETARSRSAAAWDPTRMMRHQQAAATQVGSLIAKLSAMMDAAGQAAEPGGASDRRQ
ncbi:YbaB/EbfC family nucleoid-associated protein [Actinopolymorpha pittospori]|uniref:DNA-binding protein YbaB n=1 Tax=Actinopolymorpha pittospori TaxID=648752 RepID=A0A927R6K1_9ACTN|nr:YbaB/EbfC family nucleoid-associated protein [Actinopolymorpha pittospori]MBE1603214.1 DNA-binding protein YbaB [Actinopolymorpha pittospori]